MKAFKFFIFSFLFLSVWSLKQNTVYAGNILRVDGSVTSSGDGSSWDKSFKKITDALDAAQAGDEIWVKFGAYQEPTFLMKEGGNVYGGFAGTEEQRSQRDSKINSTFLIANNFTDQILSGASFETLTEWDGFTFTSANNDLKGGAILLLKNNKVSNSEISYNTSTGDGGGVNMTDAYLDRCVVSNNKGKAGAGIRASGKSVITNCIVINNIGTNNGGGISGTDHPVVIENCLVANNETSGGNGAGIMLGDGRNGEAGRIVNCTVVRNKMTRTDKGCAGVYGSAKSANPSSCLYNTIVWGNDATIGGGANNIAGYGTTPADMVKNCAIEGIPNGFVNETNINLSSDNTGVSGSDFYPCFVNPSATVGTVIVGDDGKYAYDWRVTESSACVDKGDSQYWTAAYSSDLDGNSRITGASIDMGAYELGGSTGWASCKESPVYVRKDGKTVTIIGAVPGELISIYNIQGVLVAQRENSCAETFSLDSGMYVIKVGKSLIKVIL